MADVDLARLEFPRHLHWPGRQDVWLVVTDAQQTAAALADGWSLDLILISAEPDAVPPGAESPSQPETAVPEPPRRPGWPKGRPRKVNHDG